MLTGTKALVIKLPSRARYLILGVTVMLLVGMTVDIIHNEFFTSSHKPFNSKTTTITYGPTLWKLQEKSIIKISDGSFRTKKIALVQDTTIPVESNEATNVNNNVVIGTLGTPSSSQPSSTATSVNSTVPTQQNVAPSSSSLISVSVKPQIQNQAPSLSTDASVNIVPAVGVAANVTLSTDPSISATVTTPIKAISTCTTIIIIHVCTQ